MSRPARRMRDIPILFNVYHAGATKRASRMRQEKTERNGHQCGLTWAWVSGNGFPATDPRQMLTSSQKENLVIEDVLFADDSSLIGWMNENWLSGKEVVKRHHAPFRREMSRREGRGFLLRIRGSQEDTFSKKKGTFSSKKEDIAKIKRANLAWSKIKN